MSHSVRTWPKQNKTKQVLLPNTVEHTGHQKNTWVHSLGSQITFEEIGFYLGYLCTTTMYQTVLVASYN